MYGTGGFPPADTISLFSSKPQLQTSSPLDGEAEPSQQVLPVEGEKRASEV